MLRSGSFRRGAIGGDQMFAGALVVLILGALAATFYFTMSGSDKGQMTQEEMQTWFECAKCKETFFWAQKDLTMEKKQILNALGGELEPLAIKCDLCGAKNKAMLMLKCPNPDCGKRYVPAGFRNPLKQQQYPEKYKDICPHCNMELKDATKKKAESLK